MNFMRGKRLCNRGMFGLVGSQGWVGACRVHVVNIALERPATVMLEPVHAVCWSQCSIH